MNTLSTNNKENKPFDSLKQLFDMLKPSTVFKNRKPLKTIATNSEKKKKTTRKSDVKPLKEETVVVIKEET